MNDAEILQNAIKKINTDLIEEDYWIEVIKEAIVLARADEREKILQDLETKNAPAYLKVVKPLIDKSREQGRREGIEIGKGLVLEKCLRFRGDIKTIDDLISHLEVLQECTDCGRDFYNKRCPICAGELLKNSEARLKQEGRLEVLKEIERIRKWDTESKLTPIEFYILIKDFEALKKKVL